jgi:outer membrane lipoprotein-sorting protein
MLNTVKRNRTLLFSCPLLAGVFLLSSVKAQTPDAMEIIRRCDEKARGKTSYTEMTITVVRPTWKREMSLKSWSKGDKLALILITAPAKDKGTVSLKRYKEVWNWMPSIERTIKLPPSMMMQSWMGTDFTNDDLVKESSIVNDYTHKLVGDSTIEGLSCYKIELTPKPDAAVVWGKIISFIDKKDYMQMRLEQYDEDGYLVNIMSGSQVKTLGGKLLPSHVEMIPVDKSGQKTVMSYNLMKFDEPYDETFFTTQNMNRVK